MAKRGGVAFVCDGGGRTAQVTVIAQTLDLPATSYVLPCFPQPDTLAEDKLRREVPGDKQFYFLRNPMIMNVTGLRKLRLFLGSFFDAFRLVAGNSFSAFVGLGSYLCIPVFLFARLRRTRCIFIESYIRIDDLSISGRIVYWLRLADRVYVRHSTIKRKYPRAVLVE